MPTDLLLSSGFLAFARQCGFLAAVEERGVDVDGVFGTSSGALAGALWASGMTAAEVAAELSRQTPLSMVRPNPAFWTGALTMGPALARLRAVLPPTFAGLGRPFGVGVQAPDGTHAWLTEGDLPAAVVASCSMPWLFAPVAVGGVSWRDGGAVDRLGFRGWRALRGGREVLLHLVERTAGVDGTDDLDGHVVVRTPRSGATLWSLGDFAGQLEEARQRALAELDG